MQHPLFHLVSSYGRGAFLVQSASRPEVAHVVDFEGYERELVVCTCEAFIMGGQRCGHIMSALLYV